MTNAVITFFICLGIYFIGLIVYVLVKRARAKKQYKKDLKDKEDEVTNNESNPKN